MAWSSRDGKVSEQLPNSGLHLPCLLLSDCSTVQTASLVQHILLQHMMGSSTCAHATVCCRQDDLGRTSFWKTVIWALLLWAAFKYFYSR